MGVVYILDQSRNSGKKWCVFVAHVVKIAFNTADWGLVLSKPGKVGVSNYIINFMRDYFSDRCIVVQGGETVAITARVPQD